MLRFHRIYYFAIPLVILLSAGLHVLLPVEGDKGWLLYVVRKWFEGSRLYVDIIEVNPPLILWIYALPVWISMHVRWIEDFEALALIGLAASALSVWVGTRLIRLHPAFAGNIREQAKFALLQGLIFVFYTTQSYFFDRDHIFLVLTFPYMLRFMPSLAEEAISLPLRVLIGCMAAIGFCIKPHTIIVFAALQLFALLRKRSLSALLTLENFIIATAAILYLLCVKTFTPEYLQIILPMILATYAKFSNESTSHAYLPPFFIGMGVIFADFRPWHVTPYRRDVYYFVGVCLAFLAYALINNGWGYTYNPLYSIFMLIAAWMLWEYDWLRQEHEKRELPTRNILFGIRGCIIILAVHAGYMLLYLLVMAANLNAMRTPCDKDPLCWKNKPHVQYLEENQAHSFGTLTFDFSAWVSLMRLTGAQWDIRFNCLWMMPKLLQAGPEFAASHYWITEYVGKALAEDLNRNKPDLMFVDNSPGFMGWPHRFDLPGFLSVVPEFKKAWSRYHYKTSIDNCKTHGVNQTCHYDIYGRTP